MSDCTISPARFALLVKPVSDAVTRLKRAPSKRTFGGRGWPFDCLSSMKPPTYYNDITTNKLKVHFFYGLTGTPTRLVVTKGTASE